MPDVPHLLKSIRNALVDYHPKGFNLRLSDSTVAKYSLPTNQVTLDALKALDEYQAQGTWKFVPRLNRECYVFKTNFEKMNVGPAKTLLSPECAVGIRYMIENADVPAEWETTAWFCERVGNWFNFMTSRKLSHSFSLKNTEKFDEKVNELLDFQEIIDNMKLSPDHGFGRKPLQHGIALATVSIIRLARHLLQECGFEHFCPGRTCGDCVENVNSCLRYYNAIPTYLQLRLGIRCITFILALKPPKNGSYDLDEVCGDEKHWLANLKDLKKTIKEAQENTDEEACEFTIVSSWVDSHAQESCRTYVDGYVLEKTICSQSFCKECKNALTGTSEESEYHGIIANRCYTPNALVSPSKVALEIFQTCEATFNQNKSICESGKVDELVNSLETFFFSKFNLPKCHLNLVLRRWFKVRMYVEAKKMNKRMKESKAKDIQSASNSSRSMKQRQVT